MPRIRVSTTVDEQLLAQARAIAGHATDAALLDQALTALLARHRKGEIDAQYAVYDAQPIDDVDEWGDLATFRGAIGAS